VPLAIYQGTADNQVPLSGTQVYVRNVCRFGTPVLFQTFPGVGHFEIPAAAQADYLQWIADRLAGVPAPSNCEGS
jgi:hypothetical protein